MTVQRIGVFATRPADLSLLRRHINALFAVLPAEAEWDFRYFHSAVRFCAALGDGGVSVGVLLHTDARQPLPDLPAAACVVLIRPPPEGAPPDGAAPEGAAPDSATPDSATPDRSATDALPGELPLHTLTPARLQQAVRAALQRREIDTEVRYLQQHDGITALPRWGVLLTQIDAQLEVQAADAARSSDRQHLYCIDLKGFADLETTLGIATAEQLLRLAARRLVQRTNDRELLASGEGAQFLVYSCRATSNAASVRRAKQFAAVLTAPFELAESIAYITTAVGIAAPTPACSAAELLRQASTAATAAALTHSDGIALFDASVQRSSQRQQLKEALGYAIERDEFEVFYQPIVDLQTGAIAGAEALLRWHGHSVGAISPGHFIPLAEESGAILSIGEWVLRNACRAAVTWLDRFWQPVRLAVNVSAQQFRTRHLQDSLLRVLSEMPLSPDQIELEISERNYLALMRTHQGEFEALRDLGFRIVIDDFGSSYAPPSYLKQCPVDVLKIDRSFIAPLPGNANAAALVRGFIAMAKGLGLRVIGMGVETEAQLEFLRAAGCDEAQGFHLSHPLPGDDFISLLLRNPPIALPYATTTVIRAS